MKILFVFLTMAICFFSLVGIIIAAKVFGFSPEQFRDADAVFAPSTYLTVLAILIAPILIVLLIQKYLHKKPAATLGFSRGGGKEFTSFAAIAVALKAIATFGAFVFSPESRVSAAFPASEVGVWLPYFGWFLFTLLLNSLNEELIYRAYPLENLREKMSPVLIIILAAAVFSGMHFVIEPPSLDLFLYRFFFGTLAGLIYAETRSLTGIVGLHTGWNFVALTAGEADWKLGGLLTVTGLTERSEILANILVLLVASAFVARSRFVSR